MGGSTQKARRKLTLSSVVCLSHRRQVSRLSTWFLSGMQLSPARFFVLNGNLFTTVKTPPCPSLKPTTLLHLVSRVCLLTLPVRCERVCSRFLSPHDKDRARGALNTCPHSTSHYCTTGMLDAPWSTIWPIQTLSLSLSLLVLSLPSWS